MTPREKALELFNQYFYLIPSLFNEGQKEYILAKECAITATKNTIQSLINTLNYEDKKYGIISRGVIKQLQEQEDILEEIEKL